MLLTKGNPIEQVIAIEPFSDIMVDIKLAGMEEKYKLTIAAYVYYKKTFNMVSLISSNIEYIYTDKVGKSYRTILSVGNFPKDKITKSLVSISVEYGNVNIEDFKVEKINDNAEISSKVVNKIDNGVDDIVAKLRSVSVMSRNQYEVEQNGVGDHKLTDKIVFLSTWNTNCGIARYTEDLLNSLRKIDNGKYKNEFDVNPINVQTLRNNIFSMYSTRLTHIQHEPGLMSIPPRIKNKVIMTWHTIQPNVSDMIQKFERELDVVGYIVPCKGALEYMKTDKDVDVINLGSKIIPDLDKDGVKQILGLDGVGSIGKGDSIDSVSSVDKGEIKQYEADQKPIGFVFGFQSSAKHYDRLIKAAKNIGIHLVISGSVHDSGYRSPLLENDEYNKCDITVINKFMSDPEIDLYAIASDLLIFDYLPQNHYSSSSAMHRTVGAARPVICGRISHFNDIEEDEDCLKFSDQAELEEKIKYALDNREEFGKKALEYAKRTSREEMAKKHLDVYRRHVDI